MVRFMSVIKKGHRREGVVFVISGLFKEFPCFCCIKGKRVAVSVSGYIGRSKTCSRELATFKDMLCKCLAIDS
jgi:hypothetical protein